MLTQVSQKQLEQQQTTRYCNNNNRHSRRQALLWGQLGNIFIGHNFWRQIAQTQGWIFLVHMCWACYQSTLKGYVFNSTHAKCLHQNWSILWAWSAHRMHLLHRFFINYLFIWEYAYRLFRQGKSSDITLCYAKTVTCWCFMSAHGL